MDKIERFIGEFAFLSNFFPASVYIDGKRYQTVEHAYQAAKTLDSNEKETIRVCASPAIAKKLGRSVTLREDWDSVKVEVMRDLLKRKFENPLLRELLLLTNDAVLEEHNYWNDKFWGICRGEGQNMLGKLLTEIRESIKDGNDN